MTTAGLFTNFLRLNFWTLCTKNIRFSCFKITKMATENELEIDEDEFDLPVCSNFGVGLLIKRIFLRPLSNLNC